MVEMAGPPAVRACRSDWRARRLLKSANVAGFQAEQKIGTKQESLSCNRLAVNHVVQRVAKALTRARLFEIAMNQRLWTCDFEMEMAQTLSSESHRSITEGTVRKVKGIKTDGSRAELDSGCFLNTPNTAQDLLS